MTALARWALLGALCQAAAADAGVLLRGFVRDAGTGAGLTAATVQVKDTFVGTVANDDGEYALYVERLPVALVAVCIGYRTREIAVADSIADIDLQPAPHVLAETVVTGEEPAVAIMRRVIAAKQRWRPSLRNYRVDVYSRWTVARREGVAGVVEIASEMYWDRERGTGEHVKARRTTANLGGDPLFGEFSALDLILNFYEDDVELLGHRVMGPTHPRALDFYRFELVGQRRLDDALVHDIAFAPRSRLQPAFAGTLAVLDGAHALLAAALAPTPETQARPSPGVREFALEYRQQYRSFGAGVWLPVDLRIGIDFEFGLTGLAFPFMRRDIVQQLGGYQLNTALPDSLFGGKRKTRAGSPAAEDSLLAPLRAAVPLSAAERAAYATIDSGVSLAESFKPNGFFARFMPPPTANPAPERVGSAWGLEPRLRLNRVDEAFVGLAGQAPLGVRVSARADGGYSGGQRRWGYGGGLRYRPGADGAWALDVGYRRDAESRYGSALYTPSFNNLEVLVGGEDYFDYFWNERWRAGAQWTDPRRDLALSLRLNREEHGSLAKGGRWDPLDLYGGMRANPPVAGGGLRSATLRLRYGEDYEPWSVFARRRLRLEVERGVAALGGDFAFTRYRLFFDWHRTTLLRRRAPPNVLALRVVAQTASGELPPQRFAALDARAGGFSPFGALRTRGGLPYVGERVFGIFAEQYLRTLPFELLGLDALARRGFGLVLHGAAGRAWAVPGARGWHREAGASLVLYHLLRIDFARRLDRGGWAAGVGVAHLDFDPDDL